MFRRNIVPPSNPTAPFFLKDGIVDTIQFFVPGNPKGLKRHRSYTTHAGIHVNVDPNKADKMDFLGKALKYRPKAPLDEPLNVLMICVFPRPKSHFRTGKNQGQLRPDAPRWHASTPDGDNIWKFVGDALNGVFWKDDRVIACGVVLCIYGDVPGIGIRVRSPSTADYDVIVKVVNSLYAA